MENLTDDEVTLDIKARCRFIEKQELRVVDEPHGKGEASFHPFREAADPGRPPVPEAEGLQELFSAGFTVMFSDVIEFSGKHHVLPGREIIVYIRGLVHDPHLSPGPDGFGDDIPAKDGGRTAARVGDAGQDSYGGGLPGAIRPEIPKNLPGLNGKTDLVKRKDVTKPFRKIVYFDGMHAADPVCSTIIAFTVSMIGKMKGIRVGKSAGTRLCQKEWNCLRPF
jgi:hypothetical protein